MTFHTKERMDARIRGHITRITMGNIDSIGIA